jgi:hypothetical protein
MAAAAITPAHVQSALARHPPVELIGVTAIARGILPLTDRPTGILRPLARSATGVLFESDAAGGLVVMAALS